MATTVAKTTLELAATWLRQGRAVVSATLFEAEGSSPFPPGAQMLISGDGEVEGSVTGGCVESAVAKEALAMLAAVRSTAHLRYGISDELAGGVGLMCGGVVHIFLRVIPATDVDVLAAQAEALQAKVPFGIATVLDGAGAGSQVVRIGDEESASVEPALLRHHLGNDLRGMIERGRGGIRRFGADGAQHGSEVRAFFEVHASPPRLLIFGAVDFAAAVAPLAAKLGYRVTICDARAAFARSPRFSQAAEVVACWPQELLRKTDLGPRDAVLVFTHDPKFDEPALLGALASRVGYVGALGSRRTTAERERRLREAGVSDQALSRVHAPCGLDIGAASPEETAVSILAEIVAHRHGRTGGTLRSHRGPIHVREALPVDISRMPGSR